MNDQTCPFVVGNGEKCGRPVERTKTDGYRVQCQVCQGCLIDHQIVRAPATVLNWEEALGAVREMKLLTNGEARVDFGIDGYASVSSLSNDGEKLQIDIFPQAINERAAKLLEALARQSNFFGEVIELSAMTDFPLAYARTPEEFKAFVNYLDEAEFVRRISSPESRDICLSVTAKGHEAYGANRLGGGYTVFVSSTCYDLIDCRAELASHLQALGFDVLLSDWPELFNVPKTGHSIDSCLHNIEKSDVVICIIDQRYGRTLEAFGHSGKSATHVEIDYARSLGRPIRYFIRKQAFAEHGLMRRDPRTFESSWVESGINKGDQRQRWFDFVSDCKNAPADGQSNNWCDQFETSIDLKRIVERRIRNVMG